MQTMRPSWWSTFFPLFRVANYQYLRAAPAIMCPFFPLSHASYHPAIKFPTSVETAWLVSSALGFCLDVVVYHTFSLFVRSIMKLLVCICSGKQPCRARFLAVAFAASGICGACTLHPPTHPRKRCR